ncbi:MAG: hypothetical protein QG620_701 [Patescibacteria group bacterium]|nr:hypothetical protein [Patescibacteria group bacterium]
MSELAKLYLEMNVAVAIWKKLAKEIGCCSQSERVDCLSEAELLQCAGESVEEKVVDHLRDCLLCRIKAVWERRKSLEEKIFEIEKMKYEEVRADPLVGWLVELTASPTREPFSPGQGWERENRKKELGY